MIRIDLPRSNDGMKELILGLNHAHISPAHIDTISQDEETCMLRLELRELCELTIEMDIDIIADIIQSINKA